MAPARTRKGVHELLDPRSENASLDLWCDPDAEPSWQAGASRALAAAWELVEGTADRWLGTSLAHGYFETIDDLYSSLLGSVAAGALLAWLVMARGGDLAPEATPAETLTERE